jgi:hypothetical protein
MWMVMVMAQQGEDLFACPELGSLLRLGVEVEACCI